MNNAFELLPVLLPVILVELAMKAVAIRDILKTARPIRGDKRIWIGVVVLMTLGWAVYFLFGKEE